MDIFYGGLFFTAVNGRKITNGKEPNMAMYTVFDNRVKGHPRELVVARVKDPMAWLAKNANPSSEWSSVEATYDFSAKGKPTLYSAVYKEKRKEVYFILRDPDL